VNLVGCEEFILYRVEKDGGLGLEEACGLDTARCKLISPYCGHIGDTARTGVEYWVEEGQDLHCQCAEAGLTAGIPLKGHGVVTGVLALLRLLPQKNELHRWDRELLRLLGTHVATILFCTDWPESNSSVCGGAA